MTDKASINHLFQKPIILISKCLEFEACRYDGKIISNQYIQALKPHVKFIPICPEIEIGLGIPRDPVHIIQKNDHQILFQPSKANDLTDEMGRFSKRYLDKLTMVDGFILKTKSPSCALNTAKIFSDPEKSNLIDEDAGIFTSKVLERFPHHPKAEDSDLNDEHFRENFLTAVFTLADFRQVKSLDDLYQFHNRHNYLFMPCGQTLMHEMGAVATNIKKIKTPDVLRNYYNLLLRIFETS